jgi:copper transport protein
LRAALARRAIVALATATAMLLGSRDVANAHTVLVSAEPAANSRSPVSPTRVRLVFSEPLEPALARVSLVTSDGRSTRLAAAGDPRDVHAIIAPLSALSPGAYRVAWRVVSADGHPVEGSYRFTVDTGTVPTDTAPAGVPTAMSAEMPAATNSQEGANNDPERSTGPEFAGAPLLPAVLRGFAVGSLMALAGVLLFIAWPRANRVFVPRRALTYASVLSIASATLLALHALAWWFVASPDHSLSMSGMAAAIGTGPGTMEVQRISLALLALWAVGLARRPVLALVFAVGALGVSAMAGHSAAISPLWAVPSKMVHLLAGAAWLGGVLWLLAVQSGSGEATSRSMFRDEAQRVSGVALVAALLVTASGVAQVLLFLPSPLDVVRSAYGFLTIAKAAGTLGLVAFGAYYRSRVLPRITDDAVTRRFAMSLRRETIVFGFVILLGGLLGYVPPPLGAANSASTLHSHPNP